jgi:hypothetical protein
VGLFYDVPDVTVYYLPGTSGWSTTFDGAGTAPWFMPTPQILDSGGSPGLGTNGFGFIISWATNASLVVEATTNLANPAWTAIGTNTLSNGWSAFLDPKWTNSSARFYRVNYPGAP